MLPSMLILGLGNGVVSAVNGEGFGSGVREVAETWSEVVEDIVDASYDFGDDHAEELTNGLKFVGRRVAGEIIRNYIGHHPFH